MTVQVSRWGLLATLALAGSGCARTESGTISVFAAASLKESLGAVGKAFEAANPGVTVRFSFGASNMLASQIRMGAPVDVFVSADEKQMDGLAAERLVDTDSRFDLLSNRLVVVTHSDAALALDSPADLKRPEVKTVAIADPSGVPAGVYTTEFLRAVHLEEPLAPRLRRCNDVRGTLAMVAAGEADCGFVYRTDVAISSQVRIAFEVTGPHAPDIRYPVARILTSAGESTRARVAERFLRFLKGTEATRIFAAAGFVLPA